MLVELRLLRALVSMNKLYLNRRRLIMDKKALAIVLIATSFASSTFANNSIINKLIKNHNPASPSIVKNHKTHKQANHSYTDFSGTWIFNCGNGPTMTTVIENDEDYISLDGYEYRIGKGLIGESESSEGYTSSKQTSLEWNADGSSLIIKSIDLSKNHTNNSAIETDLSKFTLTMKNGQIHVDGEFALFEDVTQVEQPSTFHCVFSKKQ